jgi:hypothetical protein
VGVTLKYNLLSVSQLVDADLDVLFHKSSSRVLDSCGNLVCRISRIGKVFQADFSFAQSFMKCLISQSFLNFGSGIAVFLNRIESWNKRTTL